MDKEELTAYQRAELRLKCADPYIKTASRVGLDKGKIIALARELYEFITETPDKKSAEQAKAPTDNSQPPE